MLTLEIWTGSTMIEMAMLAMTKNDVEKVMLNYFGRRRDAYFWVLRDEENEIVTGVW